MLLSGWDGAIAGGLSSPLLGKLCTIKFRRDALGAAASLPVAPLTGNINGGCGLAVRSF